MMIMVTDDDDQNENIPIVQCDQKTFKSHLSSHFSSGFSFYCHMAFFIIPSVGILPGLDKGEINYQHDH